MFNKFKKEKVRVTALTRRLGFYINRLRKEKIGKMTVASVASLALVLQLTAGALPFASSTVNAAGSDDIIRGGITSKEQLLSIYDKGSDNGGHNDIKQIYTHFGVSRQDIANAKMGSYKTNDFSGSLKTIGRTNWPNSGRTAVKVNGISHPIYTGPFLDDANSKAINMPALIGKRSVDGQWFAITLNCGNIVYSVTPPPIAQPSTVACNSLTVTRTDRTNFRFTTKYTVKGATFKSVTYVISDATGKEIARTSNATYTQATAGTYTVKAIVNVTDSAGKNKTVTSEACTARFTVTPPATGVSTTPKRCTVPNKEHLSETSRACKADVPCDDTSGNDSPSDNPNCPAAVTPMCKEVGKENLRADDDNCVAPTATAMCTVVGKEDLRADSPDCKTIAPAAPAPAQELPKTGLGEDLMKVFGLGSLIASVGYYVASRRGMLSAFLDR